MSETAKCPVCGGRLTGDVDGVVICWSGCSFRCGGYALPRIAAAMEFTRWIAGQHYANGLSKAMIIQKAKEVFK